MSDIVITDKTCIPYKYTVRDILLPSTNVFNKLCTSYDKTQMFLVNSFRLTIYMFLIKMVFDNIDDDNFFKDFLLILFGLIILITLIMIIFILFKKQYFVKMDNSDKEISNYEL